MRGLWLGGSRGSCFRRLLQCFDDVGGGRFDVSISFKILCSG